MMRVLYAVVMTTLLSYTCSAQELKCTVELNTQKITGVDAATFQTLKNAITEFMNSRIWTQDQFSPEEKIECTLYINLDGAIQQDQYTGTITLQSSRPVYNSTYSSPIFNFRDLDFIFTYAPNTPLDFNITQYNSNLTSVLAYYAYLIIAMDYETMSKGGGTKYFTNAEQITNLVPPNSSESKGWKIFDNSLLGGGRNRYQIINSLMGGKYEGFKQSLYDYHYLGLDNLYEHPDAARHSILNALEKLDKTFRDNSSNVLLTLFIQAKGDELVGIFTGADQADKLKAINLLKRLDPANGPKYEKIVKG
jgi:hypothetical protein